MVFNEKNPLSDEDYLTLKDQTYQKIQELAPKFGLENVLREIPISRINAKAALTARKSGSKGFLKSTGYTDFELKLNDFLAAITNSDINDRLAKELSSYLEGVIKDLESTTDNNIVKNYDELIRDIKSNRADLRKQTRNNIENKEKDLYQKIKTWFYNERSDIKLSIRKEIEQNCQILAIELKDDIDIQGSIIQADVQDLQAKIPELNIEHSFDESIIDENLNNEEFIFDENMNENKFDFNKIDMITKSLKHSVKVEHVIMGLNAVKTVLPNLMKNISGEMIEKIATKTVTKYIPYLGTAVILAMSARDILGPDEETKQLERQQEAEKRAYERWEQQIKDIANEISKTFAREVISSFYIIIDEFYDGIIEKLNLLQNGFSDIDKENSILLERLYGIQKDITSKII